jgi:hypothetical protein
LDPLAVLDEAKPDENLRATFPTGGKLYTNDYDYDDDSDLEDDDSDEDGSDDEPEVDPQAATSEKLGNDPELVTVENSDAKSNDSSDIISVSDVDSLFSEPPDTKSETKPAASTHFGKVAVIEDVAFITYVTYFFITSVNVLRIMCIRFQAFLRYLYTNEIEFAPWGSAERRKARAIKTTPESYGIPKPSPKSIYRLASKVGWSLCGLRVLGLTLSVVQRP